MTTLQSTGSILPPGLPPEAMLRATIAGIIVVSLLAAGLVADFRCVAWLSSHRTDWEERKDAIRRRPWRWNDGIAIFFPLAIIYVSLSLLGIIGQSFFSSLSDAAQRLLLCIPTTGVQVAAILLVLTVMRRRGIRIRDGFAADKTEVGRDILCGAFFYVAAMPALAVSAWCSHLLLGKMGIDVSPQDVIHVFSNAENPVWFQTYLFILATVTAPLAEEILFRGVALPLLVRRSKVVAAVVVASLFFAAIHFHLPSMAPLFVIAVSLAMAYIYSKSILVPIVMHALFNATNIVVLLLVKDIDPFLM